MGCLFIWIPISETKTNGHRPIIVRISGPKIMKIYTSRTLFSFTSRKKLRKKTKEINKNSNGGEQIRCQRLVTKWEGKQMNKSEPKKKNTREEKINIKIVL